MINELEQSIRNKYKLNSRNICGETENIDVGTCINYDIWNKAKRIWRMSRIIEEALRETPGGMPTTWAYTPTYLKFGICFIIALATTVTGVTCVIVVENRTQSKDNKIKGVAKEMRKVEQEKNKKRKCVMKCKRCRRMEEDTNGYMSIELLHWKEMM